MDENLPLSLFDGRSSANLHILHVWDPVALSSFQARALSFSFEAGRCAPDQSRVNPLESIDTDNSIETTVDCARHNRHHAAANAYMKVRGFGAERVPADELGMLDHNLESST